MKVYPCLDCPAHRPGCHNPDICKRWAEVVREKEAWTAAHAERIRAENDVKYFKMQMVYQTKRKK